MSGGEETRRIGFHLDLVGADGREGPKIRRSIYFFRLSQPLALSACLSSRWVAVSFLSEPCRPRRFGAVDSNLEAGQQHFTVAKWN
jgi:hypothetical protein